MVSSEVAPYSKSGGLGDVCGALSKALVRAGHRVMTVSPRYLGVADDAPLLDLSARIPMGRWEHPVGFRRVDADGVIHLFVDHAMYLRSGLYGDANGAFGDNHIRFAVLCQAATHGARALLGEQVVFHCHDWQAALLPIYLRAYHRPLGLFTGAGTVLTVHNAAHQGRLPSELFVDLELPARWMSPWGVEFHGDLGLLKGGVLHADVVTTVSPTFAHELLTPGGGFGLEAVFQSRAADFHGLLNGIDADVWNPAADVHLPATYTRDDLSGKAVCKATLQAELGLPVDAAAPVLGWVGRLDPQKGVELVIESIPWIVQQGAQVVMLGSAAAAHSHYEHQLRELEARYPHNVRAWIGFSEPIAHRIEAGADLFMMPSLFEPCGLNQLYSMRYGTPPVVRRTGGLTDSVWPRSHDAHRGTGFAFDRPSGHALRDALHRAMTLFADSPGAFDQIRRNGMATELSWDARVLQWTDLYGCALARGR